ncbi:MAG: hypothetical protein ACI31A_09835 [Candidatus Limisoma sp.]
MKFTGGLDILNSISQIPNYAESGDNFWFESGTYEGNVTISAPNITLYGANTYGDSRTGTRPNAESLIKGTITVNAGGLTINGFAFTGTSCIYNNVATSASPLNGFTFIYNNVYGETLTRERNTGFIRFGTAYRGTDAGKAEGHRRYNNINISHNSFTGSDAAAANFIVLAGAYGTTNIVDNTFDDGGTSMYIVNAQNTINIKNNSFKNVGKYTRTEGTTTGDFTIFLEYLGYSNSTTVYIQNNVFDACNGQSSMFAPVRFNQGDSSYKLSPKSTTVYLNYNLFLNKTSPIGKTNAGTDYNYVFFGNDTYNSPAVVDTRFNRFSNSEYCMGLVKQPNGDASGRYFAGSTELFDFASSKGTTLDYYTNAAGGQMKDFNIAASTRVAQSFDIDDTTGDIYFAQICPNSQSGLSLGSDEPLCITRVYKNSSGGVSQQRMYLDYAGHGSNMAVCKYNGTLYIITGGKSLDTGTTPSYDGIKTQAISFVPFVAGAVANCNKDSFTYGGKTYTIHYFKNKFNRNFQYPTVDRDNRLYCERSTSGDVYYGVYDLDEVFTKWSDATPLNVVPIQKLTNKMSYTNDNSNIDELDKGFQTWDHQGFTISGDYIYHCEGVGKNNSAAATNKGSKIPTIVLHVFNWRTGELAYRKPVMKSEILSLDDGEPEGVKVHRDSKGRPHLLLGVVTGASGNRKANIFRYSLDETNGLASKINKSVITPSTTSLSFYSADGNAVTNSFTFSRSDFNGTPQLCLSGADARHFSVSCDATSWLTAKNTVTVSYKPGIYNGNHTAKLRISSAYADDVIVTLNGKNDNVSAVQLVDADADLFTVNDSEIVPAENVQIEVFNAMGQRVSGNLRSGVYMVRAQTANGKSIVKKVAIR